ncbi:MAG: efflux RND transporter periplasmic adaptor subunit [Isosphaeraceae bacterium]
MFRSKKLAATAAGFVAALMVLNITPRLAAQAPRSAADPETLVVDEATVDWIQKSNIAALREGVIDRMELQIGMPVERGKPIGYLKSELADLSVKKAQTAVDRVAPAAKSAAQKELAAAVVAINKRLNERIKGAVSYEEMKKAEAELKVAHAMTIEADELLKSDKVELELAKQALEEHTIRAPFDGIVIERMKHPGERVGQNEAVVQLGNLNVLRAYFYVPAAFAYRVKEGDLVDLQPKSFGGGAPLAIESKKFRGKVTFVDPQIQPVAETAVRVYAEFDNREHELRPGLKASVTVFLNTGGAAAAATSAATASGPGAGPRVGR